MVRVGITHAPGAPATVNVKTYVPPGELLMLKVFPPETVPVPPAGVVVIVQVPVFPFSTVVKSTVPALVQTGLKEPLNVVSGQQLVTKILIVSSTEHRVKII